MCSGPIFRPKTSTQPFADLPIETADMEALESPEPDCPRSVPPVTHICPNSPGIGSVEGMYTKEDVNALY